MLDKVWKLLFCQVFVLIVIQRTLVVAIDCYECVSTNNSDTRCHDPFHPVNYELVQSCKTAKKDYIGLFVAQFCSKIVGRREADGLNIAIRRCSLERLTETDGHCGQFRFQNELYSGCITSCSSDGCNDSPRAIRTTPVHSAVTILLMGVSLSCYSFFSYSFSS